MTIYNDIGPFDTGEGSCVSRCIEFGESYCEEPVLRIPVMPAGNLQQLYDDDVTIARMVGFINWVPSWEAVGACNITRIQDQQSGHQWPIYFRAGLYKSDVPLALQGIPTPINPLASTDWSDERPLKQWNHIWQPRGSRTVQYFQECYPMMCSVVTSPSAGALENTLSSGSGVVNIPATDTDCTRISLGSENCCPAVVESEYAKPNYWRMSLDRRTPIRLHENDDLSIFANWSMPRPQTGEGGCDDICDEFNDGENPCKMRFTMVLKVQLQFG